MSVTPTDEALIVALDFEGYLCDFKSDSRRLISSQELTVLNDLLKRTRSLFYSIRRYRI